MTIRRTQIMPPFLGVRWKKKAADLQRRNQNFSKSFANFFEEIWVCVGAKVCGKPYQTG